MEYKDLIQLYFERSNALQVFWTIYVTVVGAILTVLAAREKRDIVVASIMTLGFAAFAAVNLDAMHDVTVQRIQTRNAIRNYEPTKSEPGLEKLRPMLEPTLKVPAVESIARFHIAADALTIAGIWVLALRKRKPNEK